MSIINTIPASTTTKYTCKHLVREIIDGKNILQVDETYLNETLFLRLDKGIVTPTCKICCPSCENIYVIAATATYSIFTDATGPLNTCCTNIKNTDETIVDCTNVQFTQCLQQLQTIIGNTNFNVLLALGIIEYSTVLNKTTICEIIQEIQLSPVYSPTLLFECFKIILNKGIVVGCNDNVSFVASVETALKFLEVIP
jgi:hypothetical protein